MCRHGRPARRPRRPLRNLTPPFLQGAERRYRWRGRHARSVDRDWGRSWAPGLAQGTCGRASCRGMSSVTPINTHRVRPEREDDSTIGAGPFSVNDLVAAMDNHTRTLLARGRKERRAWLVPRTLLAADLFGLVVAYLLATLSWGPAGAFGSAPRDARVPAHASLLGDRRHAPGPLPWRPGASRSLDSR